MLVDTDVFVWNLRENLKAAELLERLSSITISAVTYMELVQGMKSKAELTACQKALKGMAVQAVPIDTNISDRAVQLVEKYYHSHSMQLADALIAATAIEYNLPLVSGNEKHFQVIDELTFQRFVP